MRSGALNTASWAAGLGRAVMGVPGPVTSAPSVGVHQLIRARDALLVTSGEEVLEAVGPDRHLPLADPREPERPRDRLARREQQVLDAVPVVHAAEAGAIARTAGLSVTGTREALLALHRTGLVEHSLGRWRLTPADGHRRLNDRAARSRLPPTGTTAFVGWVGWTFPRSWRPRWRRTSGTWSPSATSPRTRCGPTSAT